MTTPNYMINRLIKDDFDHAYRMNYNDGDFARHLLKNGFVGYDNLPNEELVEKYNARFNAKETV